MIDDALNRVKSGDLNYALIKNLTLDDVFSLSRRDDVIESTDGLYTIVQDDTNRDSLNASWHIDGLSRETPPSTILLYCENRGRGDIRTDLASMKLATDRLHGNQIQILNTIDCHYVSRDGERVRRNSLMCHDLPVESVVIKLNSRGWFTGDKRFTLENLTIAMSSLFEAIHPEVMHVWEDGDCMIFNNYKYLHRRHGMANVADCDRRLVRMWFA